MDVDIDIAQRRVANRGRCEESSIPSDYQLKLHRKHREWFDRMQATPLEENATDNEKTGARAQEIVSRSEDHEERRDNLTGSCRAMAIDATESAIESNDSENADGWRLCLSASDSSLFSNPTSASPDSSPLYTTAEALTANSAQGGITEATLGDQEKVFPESLQVGNAKEVVKGRNRSGSVTEDREYLAPGSVLRLDASRNNDKKTVDEWLNHIDMFLEELTCRRQQQCINDA